jgi:hypothetical protein
MPAQTLTTQHHGKPVILELEGTDGIPARYRVGATRFTVSMGIRFFVLRDREAVVAIRKSLRGAVARAHA